MSLRRTAFAASLLLALSAAHAQTPTHPLNDTGITWSGHDTSGNADTCDPAHRAGQDCHYGRDAAAAAGQLTKIGAGAAGFDFTKICMSGEAAGEGTCPASPTQGTGPNDWACTRDNVTGLVWEVKVDDEDHLRHMGHTYSWYDSDSPDGNPGTANGGTCKPDDDRCDTEKYVEDVNAASLCGFTDWRMPTVKELEGIVDFGRADPAIDLDYFPNAPSPYVWSGSPYAGNSNHAWLVNFSYGDANHSLRFNDHHVRLVRGGQ